MSPIDDELRLTLAARSVDATLDTDPLPGIEARARKYLRRRTTGTALGAALSVALVAIAIPSLRTAFDSDKPNRVGVASADPSASAGPSASAVPIGEVRSPLTWPTYLNDSPGQPTEIQGAVREMNSQFPDLRDVAVVAEWSESFGKAQLVVGEYTSHGSGPHDSAYVVGLWLAHNSTPASMTRCCGLVGLHDVAVGVTQISAAVTSGIITPLDPEQKAYFASAPGYGTAYAPDFAGSTDDLQYEPVFQVHWQPGAHQQSLFTRELGGGPVTKYILGQGLSFPDL